MPDGYLVTYRAQGRTCECVQMPVILVCVPFGNTLPQEMNCKYSIVLIVFFLFFCPLKFSLNPVTAFSPMITKKQWSERYLSFSSFVLLFFLAFEIQNLLWKLCYLPFTMYTFHLLECEHWNCINRKDSLRLFPCQSTQNWPRCYSGEYKLTHFALAV